jgi:hypothetical protein
MNVAILDISFPKLIRADDDPIFLFGSSELITGALKDNQGENRDLREIYYEVDLDEFYCHFFVFPFNNFNYSRKHMSIGELYLFKQVFY